MTFDHADQFMTFVNGNSAACAGTSDLHEEVATTGVAGIHVRPASGTSQSGAPIRVA